MDIEHLNENVSNESSSNIIVTKRTATEVYWGIIENMTCSGCESASQADNGFVVSSFHFAVCHRDRSLFVNAVKLRHEDDPVSVYSSSK